MSSGTHAEFGMYPFESVAWAWDELWAAVRRRAPWLPGELTRSGDVHARWYDTDCIVTHVCGGPFAALHRNDMELVIAFDLDIAEAERGHYHSVLLSPDPTPVGGIDPPGVHVVANSADSLSGWFSLLAATVGPGRDWPGAVTFTSSHLDSLRALAKGEADLACIDSWSLALIGREEPEILADLHRVGLGPRIPTPPITVRKSVAPDRRAELRAAFIAAMTDPSTADARASLRITGPATNTLDDYLATLSLGTPT